MKTVAFVLLALATPTFAAPAPDPGAVVYKEVCQACHMENAMGAEGAGRIAALARNRNLESADYPITVVTGGKGPMPWFRGGLSDQQIADVVNYVRSHYGNHYRDKITAADVAERGVKAPPGRER
ncbi:c-type cytochrome [Polymorphobacter fuscus]|uniref:C-type cytochrome n=1 Tax=Sandarakinorhabdus fusca TaxID=1439888 RepID=A0A7C9KXU1_9SPHN|nr:c-type cytochrome [Polymorphobacter fuscus]KAB7644901.1 c-type cytochrome [Polymorphobacter fuscus]MQT18185.1 c-type cytochrome [Polymorphobacter fuscus]